MMQIVIVPVRNHIALRMLDGFIAQRSRESNRGFVVVNVRRIGHEMLDRP